MSVTYIDRYNYARQRDDLNGQDHHRYGMELEIRIIHHL